MRTISALLLVTFLITGCEKKIETSEVEIGVFTPYYLFPETLNGKVKEVYERNYLAREENGQLIKGDRLTLGARDSVIWTNDFHLLYDETGNLLECDQIDENDGIIDIYKMTYEGDKMVNTEYFRDDTLRGKIKSGYDENGFLSLFENFRMPVDTLTFKASVISDENGNYLEMQYFDPQGQPTGKFVFTLNENNRRTGIEYINREGEKTMTQQLTYNEMGSMAKQVIITRDSVESVTEYEYEYDDAGNWIVVKCRSNSTPDIIAERMIAYYED